MCSALRSDREAGTLPLETAANHLADARNELEAMSAPEAQPPSASRKMTSLQLSPGPRCAASRSTACGSSQTTRSPSSL